MMETGGRERGENREQSKKGKRSKERGEEKEEVNGVYLCFSVALHTRRAREQIL